MYSIRFAARQVDINPLRAQEITRHDANLANPALLARDSPWGDILVTLQIKLKFSDLDKLSVFWCGVYTVLPM
jgi:hypothetical protein